MLYMKVNSFFDAYLNFITRLRVVPFRWNAENSVLKLYSSKGKDRWIYYAFICFDIILTIMLLISWIGSIMGSSDKGFDELILPYLLCIYFCLGLVLEIIILYKELDFIDLINKYFQTVEQVGKFEVAISLICDSDVPHRQLFFVF